MNSVNTAPALSTGRREKTGRLNLVLIVLALLQLAAVAYVFRPQNPVAMAGVPLFGELNADAVTMLTITDNLGRTVTLSRSADGWVLDGTDGWPANAKKIEETVTKLLSIKAERQVTRTSASHSRLQVAADNFQRRITIATPGDNMTLLLGSSAGAAATHVRAENADAVYLTGAIATWELETLPSSWIDTAYFRLDLERIRQVTLENSTGSITVVPDGDEWTLADLAPDESPLTANIRGLVSRATSINLNRPLGKQDDPIYGLAAPQATLTILADDEQGNPTTYTLLVGNKDPETNTYFFKASTSDFFVAIPGFTGDEFTGKSRADFIAASPSSPEESAPDTSTPDMVSSDAETDPEATPAPLDEEPAAEE